MKQPPNRSAAHSSRANVDVRRPPGWTQRGRKRESENAQTSPDHHARRSGPYAKHEWTNRLSGDERQRNADRDTGNSQTKQLPQHAHADFRGMSAEDES